MAAFVAIALALAGCPPNEQPTWDDKEGEYTVAQSRLLGTDSTFSIRDKLVYPVPNKPGIANTSLNVPDNELAIDRCSWCHECGFEAAFDWDNYGSSDWSPQYVGEEWAPIVERMMRKEMSFLQEEGIVKRIFEYLRDDTLGVYNVDEDDMGAVRIEVDELPTPADPAMVIDPGEEGPGGGDDAPPADAEGQDA